MTDLITDTRETWTEYYVEVISHGCYTEHDQTGSRLIFETCKYFKYIILIQSNQYTQLLTVNKCPYPPNIIWVNLCQSR